MSEGLGGLSKQAQSVVLFAFIVAIGLIVLGNFQSTTSVTTAANSSLTKFVTGLGTYADWVGIIIIVGIAGYLFYMMKKAMA